MQTVNNHLVSLEKYVEKAKESKAKRSGSILIDIDKELLVEEPETKRNRSEGEDTTKDKVEETIKTPEWWLVDGEYVEVDEVEGEYEYHLVVATKQLVI
jgi:hypothetical protein